MSERISLGGVTNTEVIFDDGKIHVVEQQDCQAILDSNQRKRDHRFDSWSPEGTVREEFQIPMTVLWQFKLECGHDLFTPEFDAYMNHKLAQPEFKYLVAAPTMRDPHIIIKGAR